MNFRATFLQYAFACTVRKCLFDFVYNSTRGIANQRPDHGRVYGPRFTCVEQSVRSVTLCTASVYTIHCAGTCLQDVPSGTTHSSETPQNVTTPLAVADRPFRTIPLVACHCFATNSQHVRKIVLSADELLIVDSLNTAVSAHPNVQFGSYPYIENPAFKTVRLADPLLVRASLVLRAKSTRAQWPRLVGHPRPPPPLLLSICVYNSPGLSSQELDGGGEVDI